MNKMKDVFVESYIEVPESKVDLVDELAESVEELETKLNAIYTENDRQLNLPKNLKHTSVIHDYY